MKCARLHLQERSKVKIKAEALVLNEKPRRCCQKRLVNPGQEEGQQRLNLWDRLHCDKSNVQIEDTADGVDTTKIKHDTEDLVLTVQTLKFEGNDADLEQVKRPRTSFKYKTFTGGHKHRMFVKQALAEIEYSDDERSSEMTYYYIDDYLKYLNYNSDKCRPISGKSSIFKRGLSQNYEDNQVSNVKIFHQEERRKFLKFEPKNKTLSKKNVKNTVKEETRDISEITDDTRIIYQKTAKRKSLTISRNQSPETVHIIRVDVVCNHPTKSALSDYDTKKEEDSPKLANINVKNNLLINKYLLTNSIKTLEEKVSGGSKVTLLCKTFKLADRSSKYYGKSNGGLKQNYV